SSQTKALPIHGYRKGDDPNDPMSVYGSDREQIEALIATDADLGKRLHADYPVTRAQVVWAARAEMARTVEDVLSRRTRMLLLNARVSIEMAPMVADILANELGHDIVWRDEQVAAYNE